MALAFGCVATNGLAMDQEKNILDSCLEFYYSDSLEAVVGRAVLSAGLEVFVFSNPAWDFELDMLLRQIDKKNQLPQGPIVDCDDICNNGEAFYLYTKYVEEVCEKRQAGYMQVLSDFSESKYKKSKSSKYSDYVAYVEERVLDNRRHIDRQVFMAREAYVKSIADCWFNKSFNNLMHEINEKNY